MKRKLIVLLLIFIIVSMFFINKTYADSEGTVNLTTSKTTVEPGEEFKITISAKCSNGITGLATIVKYDEEVLEIGKSETINSNYKNFASGAKIALMWGMSPVEEYPTDLDLYSITFKVKENTKETSTTINLEPYVEEGFNSVTITDKDGNEIECVGTEKTINIKVENAPSDNGNNNEQSGSNNGNNNDNSGSDSGDASESEDKKVKTNTSKGTTSNENNSKESLPYTGIEENIVLIATIVAISIFGIVSYNLYKKYGNI